LEPATADEITNQQLQSTTRSPEPSGTNHATESHPDMNRKLTSWLLVSLISAAPSASVLAQGMMGGGAPKDPSKGLAGVFGKKLAFTAQAKGTVKETPTSNAQTLEFGYALLDGRSRVEMDMTKMMGGGSNDDIEMMKQMGMDRMVILNQPDKKATWMIYPGLKAYCAIPSAEEEAADEKAKVERTELGKETVDGHPCVKWKVTTTKENGETSELVMWTATDLNDFPIQCEVPTAKGGTSTTLFQDIKTSKPAASLFEAPADYKRYGSMQELMMSSMQRMMQ
jgi:hypothetical protein